MSRHRQMARFFQRTLPVVAILALLFSALYLAGDATRGLGRWSQYYQWLFPVAGIALLILAGAIVRRLVLLIRRLRDGQPGSRLTLRMVILFVALSVPPAFVVYLFSVDFLNRSIDSWFDVEVAAALDDAMEIGRRFLEMQKIERQALTSRLASRLADRPDGELSAALREMIAESGALELTVLTSGGRVIRTSSRDLDRFAADLPEDFQLVQARRSGSFVVSEPALAEGDTLQVRVLHAIPDRRLGPDRLLQGIFEVPQGFDEQADRVEREYERYESLAFQRTALKRSFVLILSMVLVLSVMVAILLAFNTARRLVQPLGRLSEATRSIAAGDYQRRLPVPGRDELGFLVSSFNRMTDEIERSSEEAAQARRDAETRRDYLEAVLGRLSSGVLSLDPRGRIQAVNEAACQILDLPAESLTGASIDGLPQRAAALQPLTDLFERRRHDAGDWREELTLEIAGNQRNLMCRGARLPASRDGADMVLVFDDLTDLVRAQREAAWGEVARRLAHEVRNPLTPIQLSAERLRHKYLDQMAAEDAAVLDRATRTIVTQVEALKTMVNAFSDYARAPTLQLEPTRLGELVEEIAEFYRQGSESLQIAVEPMDGEPPVLADRGRLRQLLHNLIKNAQEATADQPLALHLTTHLEWRGAQPILCLIIRDNGPGLPVEIMDKLFEPYATTKDRGTGIGLAIVKKIAEEHGGDIRARNASGGGAIFELRLPADRSALAVDDDQRRQRSV